MAHIGYKKGKDDRIIVLEILGINNELRKDIVNKDFAKMRCSKAKVIDIYDINNKDKKFNNAFGVLDKTFKYIVDEIVEPDKYNNNIDVVCTNGIHYFLNEDAAFNWLLDSDNYTGEHKEYLGDGQIQRIVNYVNGIVDGSIKIFNSHGQLSCKYNCTDGLKNGVFEEWYENGQPSMKCMYDNGLLNGVFEAWHENGQLQKKCNYNKHVINGKYEEWFDDGRIKSTEMYVNGQSKIPHNLIQYYGQPTQKQYYQPTQKQYYQPTQKQYYQPTQKQYYRQNVQYYQPKQYYRQNVQYYQPKQYYRQNVQYYRQ
jgi:hypothetical protein